MPIAGPDNGALLCTPCITYSVQQPFLKNVLMFIFERERERQAEREGDTESEAGSRLQTVNTEPGAGLKPMNCEIMT